jgi:DNA-binding transcriptional ArsR family regulator
MRQLKNNLLPHRNTLYLIITCLVLLSIMFTMTVGKDILTRKRLERQLSETSRQVEISKLLAPLMTELRDDGNTADPENSENTDLSPLLGTDAENYYEVIEQIIRQCDLGPATVSPDIESVLSDAGYIQVNLTTRGTFSNFRRLIMQLGRLPYLSGIDRYHVRRAADPAGLELFLKLRIKIASPAGNTNDQ